MILKRLLRAGKGGLLPRFDGPGFFRLVERGVDLAQIPGCRFQPAHCWIGLLAHDFIAVAGLFFRLGKTPLAKQGSSELDACVEKLARQLAQCGPEALARSKQLLRKVAKAPISPQLGLETARVLAETRAGEEAREGIRSFLEKRRPKWSA